MDSYETNIRTFHRQLSAQGLVLRFGDALKKTRPDGVVVVGMGGSALSGDILASVGLQIGLHCPVKVWKNYDLPEQLPCKNPFYIFCSFSGTTEETLSGLMLLLKKKRRPLIGVVTTGGKLERIAEQHRFPVAWFDKKELAPRQSTGFIFYGLVKLLRVSGLSLRVPEYTKINPLESRARGASLAKKILRGIIMIYSDSEFAPLGYIWKVRLNETAKSLAFSGVLPEINHNELTAFDLPIHKLNVKAAAIFLINTSCKMRLRKRFMFTEKLLRDRGVCTLPIMLQGSHMLEKIWRSLVLADWTSYFLATHYRIPKKELALSSPRIVTELKHLMQ